MRMIDEDEVGLKRQKDYIKIIPEAPGVQEKNLMPNFAIIGTADAGKFQVRQAWRHLAVVWNVPVY